MIFGLKTPAPSSKDDSKNDTAKAATFISMSLLLKMLGFIAVFLKKAFLRASPCKRTVKLSFFPVFWCFVEALHQNPRDTAALQTFGPIFLLFPEFLLQP